MNYQAPFLAWKSDAYCFYGHQSINREFEDKKNSEVKKISNISTTNYNNSGSGQTS